jgi:diaminohydroxyphosphoribosylaminopyrimidine deaminase/5-amino-6-(5-phosphoribosylamino)uracil reductase
VSSDIRFMRMALSLGRRGLGRVWPWPSVGCVLVKEGRIVGRGVSDKVTWRHAEPVALAQAGPHAKGATAYVTLEPCSHHGSTPPCCDALIKAGVARVVTALSDPNPLVAGQGLERLRSAGIEVKTGVCADEARRDHAGFLRMITQGMPFVTLKLANSFDGRIATASGQSQWITGSEARRYVHVLRASHDAVLVGGGTARMDDPTLTVRGLGISHQPVRVVASRHLDLPLTSKLAQTAGDVPLWLCHGKTADAELCTAWDQLGAKRLECDVLAGQLDPVSMLKALGTQGITRVFCEGGGTLAASLLEAGLVDQLIGFTAGFAIGAEGLPNIGALGLETLHEAKRFELVQMRPIGADMLHIWRS